MPTDQEPIDPLDVVVGLVAVALTAAQVVRRAVGPLDPLARVLLRPLAGLGRAARGRFGERVDALVPVVVDAGLRHLQPTEVIRRNVDLDQIVALVDLDAVASRLDVEAVIARVDLDAIAARLDVEAVVARVDLDQVASRLDIDALLDQLDLTAMVLGRVDLGAMVEAVLTQVDVPALVEEVLDEIDLPEIIRESTGSMASDTVRGVRMQGVNADEAVSRVIGRLLLRRGRPAPGAAT